MAFSLRGRFFQGAALFAAAVAPMCGAVLSLDEAIARALRQNQRIKVSSFNRGIARANVLTAYGQFDPALTFRRTYSENEIPVTTTPLLSQLTKRDDYSLALEGATPWGMTYALGTSARNERGTFNGFSNEFVTFGGLSVTQPLLKGFGFGYALADLRIAKADRAISDWEHRQTVIDIITATIYAYEGLAEARATLRITERSRDLAAQLVSDNERRNRVGAISDADVTQARARVANRDERILIARQAVREVENRLRQLIGEPPIMGNANELEVAPLAAAPVIAVDGAADLRRALELRPDFQAAKLGLVRRRATQARARNDVLPRVDFVGSYGYNGIDSNFAASRAQVRDQDHRAYSAGVVVSIPITFAEGRGRMRAAQLALQQSEADLVRLEQDIAVSVTDAVGELETTAKRVAATTRAYELALQALDAEQKRFRAGTSSTFFVLQLQEQLAAVEINQVQAVADARRAIVTYEHEIGLTLRSHGITLD